MRRVARLAAVGPGDRVVEIGAGLGSLTLALVETGAEVTAVETDQRLVEVLGEVVAGHPVRVIHADALELDWDRLLEPGRGWHLVANLPYNVAIPLVLDLLRDVPAFERMLVMVQRQAGERLAAEPGDRSYGVPSVKAACFAQVSVVGSVPKTVFHPAPNVESVLVDLARRPQPAVDVAPEALFRLVEAGFAGRRKMLRRSLSGLVDPRPSRPPASAPRLGPRSSASRIGAG